MVEKTVCSWYLYCIEFSPLVLVVSSYDLWWVFLLKRGEGGENCTQFKLHLKQFSLLGFSIYFFHRMRTGLIVLLSTSDDHKLMQICSWWFLGWSRYGFRCFVMSHPSRCYLGIHLPTSLCRRAKNPVRIFVHCRAVYMIYTGEPSICWIVVILLLATGQVTGEPPSPRFGSGIFGVLTSEASRVLAAPLCSFPIYN